MDLKHFLGVTRHQAGDSLEAQAAFDSVTAQWSVAPFRSPITLESKDTPPRLHLVWRAEGTWEVYGRPVFVDGMLQLKLLVYRGGTSVRKYEKTLQLSLTYDGVAWVPSEPDVDADATVTLARAFVNYARQFPPAPDETE